MDPDDLIRDIDRRAGDGPALGRLRVAVDTADDLRHAADQVLDHFVRAARDEGRSWSEIGETLGVSKQAAQQRFVPRPAPDWPPAFHEAAREAIAAGGREARAFGHSYLATEHVLLGLLEGEPGPAREALTQLGVTAPKVREGIERIVGRGAGSGGGSLGVAPRLKRALERAVREARRSGGRCPRAEHLLLALCEDRQSVAARVLAELGVDAPAVRERIAALLEAEAPELAERMRRPRRRILAG